MHEVLPSPWEREDADRPMGEVTRHKLRRLFPYLPPAPLKVLQPKTGGGLYR
jgi:hypothetical protein